MSKLLINEPPLQVLPSLALAIGLNEAIFLQQLHYWLTPTVKYKPHYREYEGVTRPWIYNTYHTKEGDKETGWQANFPFWSVRTIKRVVGSLKGKGLIIATDQFNAASSNRTLWYTIDYDKLATYEAMTTSGTLDSDNLALSDGDNLALSREGQLGTLMTETTETNTETTSPPGGNGSTNTDKQPTPPKSNTNLTPQQKNELILVGKHPNVKMPLTEQQADELLIFGKHPDSDTANPSFDTIQEIQAAGWQVRNHIVEQAIAYYIEAIREHDTAFSIPNDKSVRGDWYKSVNGHLQDYRADDLKVIYPAAIQRLKERGMSFRRPGSLTKSLPNVAMETQTGDVVAWL